MKIKEFLRQHRNKLIVTTLLGIPVIAGTYSGNEGGFPPFYNKKVGTSVGINVGFSTEFMPDSKFYGISLSVVNENKGGTLNGLNIGVANMGDCDNTQGKTNGLEISLINTEEHNKKRTLINGCQIGFINSAKEGNVFQIGGYNSIEQKNGKIKRGVLINYKFGGRNENR